MAVLHGLICRERVALAARGWEAGTVRGMSFRLVSPDGLEWITRPHEVGEPARHVAELSEVAEFAHTRANVWRYEPGARGRRHRHPSQEETFVVLEGTLTMYLGEPAQRVGPARRSRSRSELAVQRRLEGRSVCPQALNRTTTGGYPHARSSTAQAAAA